MLRGLGEDPTDDDIKKMVQRGLCPLAPAPCPHHRPADLLVLFACRLRLAHLWPRVGHTAGRYRSS